jgi:hypothetical protein
MKTVVWKDEKMAGSLGSWKAVPTAEWLVSQMVQSMEMKKAVLMDELMDERWLGVTLVEWMAAKMVTLMENQWADLLVFQMELLLVILLVVSMGE